MTLPLHTKANMIRNGTVTEVSEDVVFLATSNDIIVSILRTVQKSAHREKLEHYEYYKGHEVHLKINRSHNRLNVCSSWCRVRKNMSWKFVDGWSQKSRIYVFLFDVMNACIVLNGPLHEKSEIQKRKQQQTENRKVCIKSNTTRNTACQDTFSHLGYLHFTP